MKEKEKKGLIMFPYAYQEGKQTGTNIGRTSRQLDIYLKNACVACLSARQACGTGTDVALVTNIDVPEPYAGLLAEGGVQIIHCPFDRFDFDGQYKWALAFYKLCALWHAVREQHYACYAYMDTDVYVQHGFDEVWAECEGGRILLYDFGHGLHIEHYRHIVSEFEAFRSDSLTVGGGKLTHYGGEFFAAGAEAARQFADRCEAVYEEMRRRGFVTTHGDEFIVSLAAEDLKTQVKNAAPYVFRFWTGTFRLVSTCYAVNPVHVLHVPAEKEYGMLRLYDRYMRHGRVPSRRAVWRTLHLTHRSLRTCLAQMIKKLRKQ